MEDIEQFVTDWLCQLGNVENPDYAIKSIQDSIYTKNPPDLNPNKLVALGKAEALFSVLKHLTPKTKKE